MKIAVTINFPKYMKNKEDFESAGIESKVLRIIKNNLFVDRHKKSLLKIKFDILEMSTEILHYCILSSSLAITNLGIEQKGILTCSNVVINANDILIVDPPLSDELGCKSKFQLACLVDTEEVVSFIQSGSIHEEPEIKEQLANNKFKDVISLSIQICKAYKNYLSKLI